VLQECIQRAGSVQAGLKFYVGAALHPDDGGYGDKVLAEHARLKEVANGRAPLLLTPPTPIRTAAPMPIPTAPAKDDEAPVPAV